MLAGQAGTGLKNLAGNPDMLLAALGSADGWEGAGSMSLVPVTSPDHQCLSLTFHDFVSLGGNGK